MKNLDRYADAQIIVNATPIGMAPDWTGTPVDLTRFPRCEGVLDVICYPLRTTLLLQAQELGHSGGRRPSICRPRRLRRQTNYSAASRLHPSG